MGFSSWLRKWTANRARRAQHRPAAPRFRPQLEALEDRWLPSTLTVMNNLDDGSVGSLGYEIGQAQSGDTIVFDQKNLSGQTITLSGAELYLDKDLTIQGLGASKLAISGGNQSRLFEVAAGAQVTLSGMTIENGDGFASNSGTVLWDSGSSFEDGGAILNWGTLTLSGDTLSGNSALDGGGIANEYSGTLTLTGSTLSGNFAFNDGGGISNDGTTTLSGSTVTQNTGGTGGGIYNDGSLTILDKSVVEGNSPDDVYNLGTFKHKDSKIGTVDG